MIFNRERARQLYDFEGLNVGSILPTDLDGLIEYHDEAYILYEFKYKGTDMPTGQRIAIERMVNDLCKSGKQAVAFLCRHEVKNPDEDVLAKDAIVTSVYWNGTWFDCNENVKDKTDKYISWLRRTK